MGIEFEISVSGRCSFLRSDYFLRNSNGGFGRSHLPGYPTVKSWKDCGVPNPTWLAGFPSFREGITGILIGICLAFSFLVFLIAAFAETNRLPFDLPEAETELVGGYHTEYSGMRFALFFLGEYAAMISASAIMVTLFLGGWSLPLPWFNSLPMPDAIFGLVLPSWLAGQPMLGGLVSYP